MTNQMYATMEFGINFSPVDDSFYLHITLVPKTTGSQGNSFLVANSVAK